MKYWKIAPGKKIHRTLCRIKTPFEGLTDFGGLSRAPQTEQELIILFSKLNQHLKMKIESVSTIFPDAYVRMEKRRNWSTVPAEFELNSADSKSHGNIKNLEKGETCCIICRKDDWSKNQ